MIGTGKSCLLKRFTEKRFVRTNTVATRHLSIILDTNTADIDNSLG